MSDSRASPNAPAPTEHRFRALARSSPWRWTSVEFDWAVGGSTVAHAWVRRPGGFRVERADGMVTAGEQRSPREVSGYSFADDGVHEPGIWPRDVEPRFDAEGLVSDYPRDVRIDFDAPYHRNYHWVAMISPFELADGNADVEDDPAVLLTDLAEVDHHGRRTWQATVQSRASYDPRCDCCALLSGEFDDDRQEWTPDVAATVRLDVATGICVYVEHHRTPPDVDLDLRIVAVDEHYDDALFTPPPPRRRDWWRRRARAVSD